jgi:glycosyltransferase involved in cell wall biosynthesis
MKVLFIWSGMSGYLGDALRGLTRLPGVELRVFNEEPLDGMTRFDPKVVLHGLEARVISVTDKREVVVRLEDEAAAWCPEVIFIVGWCRRLSRWFAWSRRFDAVPKVLILDLPFAWTFKKLIAPVVLWPYLRRFSGCFVPKTSAVRYACWLGFKGGIGDRRAGLGWIDNRFESINVRKFDGVAERRWALPECPRRFLFVGRYAPEKGIGALVSAYRRYRALARADGETEDRLWVLDCYGAGPLARMLADEPGVTDMGFVQPDVLPEIMQRHGAFVIASSHEPWGAVIAEAAAAGLPVVCTEACGAAAELVKGNGVVCKVGDIEGMAQAMLRLHRMDRLELAEMGMPGRALAEPYSSENWAQAVIEIVQNI